MFHNYYFKNRDDLIYFNKGSALIGDNEKSCIFTIDFNKVISYNIKNTQWFFDCFTPALAINIMFEGGTEYILMKKNISLEEIVFNDKNWCKEYLTNGDVHSLIYIFNLIYNL